MAIARIDIHRFRIPFSSPVKAGKEVLTRREGFILVLTDDGGRSGCGEIAPLPGFDETTLSMCRRDLPALRNVLHGLPLRFDRFDPAAPFLGITSIPNAWTPHTLFGVESALLGLYLQKAGIPRLSEPLRIRVNGLFIPEAGPADRMDRKAETLERSGVRTVKIKIGRLAAEEEIRQILHLAGRLGTDVTLRLDGNRNLTAAAYRRYYEALGHLPVEYVEEPIPELSGAEAVLWPLALDESLAGLLDPDDPRPSSLPKAVRAIILKPGLLRGLHAMASCAAAAAAANVQTILSSAFNTGVALATLGIFARIIGLPPETAHGLDTLRYLVGDILLEPPSIHEGMLTVPGSFVSGGWRLNPRFLVGEAI